MTLPVTVGAPGVEAAEVILKVPPLTLTLPVMLDVPVLFAILKVPPTRFNVAIAFVLFVLPLLRLKIVDVVEGIEKTFLTAKELLSRSLVTEPVVLKVTFQKD